MLILKRILKICNIIREVMCFFKFLDRGDFFIINIKSKIYIIFCCKSPMTLFNYTPTNINVHNDI